MQTLTSFFLFFEIKFGALKAERKIVRVLFAHDTRTPLRIWNVYQRSSMGIKQWVLIEHIQMKCSYSNVK